MIMFEAANFGSENWAVFPFIESEDENEEFFLKKVHATLTKVSSMATRL